LDYFYSEDNLTEYHNAGLGFSIIPGVLEKIKEPTVYGAKHYLYDEKIDGFFPSAPATFGYAPSKGLKVEGKTYADAFTEVIIGAADIDEVIADLNERYNAANDKAIADGEYERIIIDNFSLK